MKFTGASMRSLAIAALLLIFVFLVAHALGKKIDHDEEGFVAAGALLLRSGSLPYLDYPLFQMPNLAFIFAVLFSTNQWLLLTARCFNAICAFLTLILVFTTGARLFRTVEHRHWFIGAGSALILCLNPIARFTVGRAWNHDLPVLAAVLALFAMLHGFQSRRAGVWFFICGGLVGVAVGTRLTFTPLAGAFVVALMVFPSPRMSRVKSLTLFCTGLVVALVPTIALLLAAPRQFLFDNFTYHGALERAFQESAAPHKITLFHRGRFVLSQFAKSPSTAALAVGLFYFGIRPWYRSGWREIATRREVVSVCLILPFLLAGSWAPIPPHRQYYYVLIPFLLLGNLYGLAHERVSAQRVGRLMLAVIALCLIEFIPDFSRERVVFHPGRWGAVTVHQQGAAIRSYVQTGPILTLEPIYPLEGGLTIYKEFANGVFAWRTAPFVGDEKKVALDILGRDDLETFLQSHPPAAAFTKSNFPKEKLPIRLLQSSGYVPQPLEGRRTLWLRPGPAN